MPKGYDEYIEEYRVTTEIVDKKYLVTVNKKGGIEGSYYFPDRELWANLTYKKSGWCGLEFMLCTIEDGKVHLIMEDPSWRDMWFLKRFFFTPNESLIIWLPDDANLLGPYPECHVFLMYKSPFDTHMPKRPILERYSSYGSQLIFDTPKEEERI
jgi:hypothetical protein